ncbi:MAG: endolytic transglycosylase MltG [Acetobacteraceae bacterium]|nr:endolytic transglycosylase MltG [Acetobacteraceae bacterium]
MLAWLAGLLLLLGAASAAGWLYARHLYRAPGPLAQAVNLVVPRGGEEVVAKTLADALVIEHPLAFRVAALATESEGPLRAGEFAFPAHASLRTVLTVLRTARPVQHRLTIPEGLTAPQIAALLDKAPALSGADTRPPEGQLLPQTYAYEWDTPREAIVARARAAMNHALTDAWATRAADLPLASPEQVLVLASIVERETAKPEERAHVAAVYLNRLRLGMKLQSDPTVVYAASGGTGALDRPLTHADLDRDDPYNTYRVHGLPPGPICAPGLASIRAATQPAKTDDLYFVADGSGGHVFSRTFDEHARHVMRSRAISQPTETR